jgi:glyoxylase-like metal-dependent hydrolase (beta-lactamase superfamily II)
MAGRTLPVQGFLVKHPAGLVLFDTGLGETHEEFDRLLSPSRRSLEVALAEYGVRTGDITAVVNCHFHYDHCGGNNLFAGVPTFVQAREYAARARLNWYIAERVEFPGAELRTVDGVAQVLPGMRVVPTPGHTPGHQSLVIEDKAGPVIVAGQAAYTAAEFESPRREPARGWKTAWDGDAFLRSIEYLRSLNPRLVYFSHDTECWTP